MQPQQQGGAGNCIDDIKRWWTTVPCGVKFIYYTSIGVVLIDMFLRIQQYLACSPHLILKFQIWRMFTTQFCNDIMGLIFGLLSLTFTGIMLEKSIGTISFILDFLFKNFLIQLVHFIMVLTLSLIFQTSTTAYSFGLFNIVILYMSLRCFSDPETPSNFLCFPIQFKNKYQPFAIILFFTLLSGQLRLDFVAAVILGFVEVRFYGGMMLRLSAARIASLKDSIIFKNMTTRSDFVDPNAPFLVQSAAPQQSSQPSSSSTTNNFAGRGVTIGGAPSQAAPQQVRPNQQQYVVNPSQQQHDAENAQPVDFQQFAGKGVSIGGASGGNTLSIQQQRDLQMRRLQQQQQSSELESGDNKLDIETNADTSNDSNNPNIRNEQKNQQKKDGYTALNEDLL